MLNTRDSSFDMKLQQMRCDLAALDVELKLCRLIYLLRKYSPSQPRVPAGSHDAGQWTRGGGGGGGAQDSAAAGQDAEGVSDTLDEGRSGGPGPVIVERLDRTGNPKIDQTTDRLVDVMKRVASVVGEGQGLLYATTFHVAFANIVRAENIEGIGEGGVEQSFSFGDVVRYGTDGSKRTDVVLRDPDGLDQKPIAVWDLKTGDAVLTASRVRELRRYLDIGPEVPIIELHARRGVSIKAFAPTVSYVWMIRVTLWTADLERDPDRQEVYVPRDIW
jgi:hypothetical protein